ncbi:MAG: histidinol-phosphate transaminase [Bacteroidetes bacterium RIFCSPLOWO2_12_FULL_35_15]|nr:MAG: histidinol-phosphate transaminase [Bacteroidetes bacterium RIFCSPLOWO2_12_FULL_35_15]
MIKLSANENFYGCSPFVKKVIEENAGSVSVYPDYQQGLLKEKIASKYDVPVAKIILGVGTVGIIDAIIRLLVKEDEEIITFERSFVAYGQLANLYKKKIHYASLTNFSCDTIAIFPLVNPKTKVVFIANPNNPTGTIINETQLKAFLNKIPSSIYVVVDEAYFEYVSDNSFPNTIELQKKHPNLIILRGFSKIYGLAGLRIGYGIAEEKTAAFLENFRVPFSINSLSSIAAMAALEDQNFVKKCSEQNKMEREFLVEEIKKIGYNVFPSHGNFLFMFFESNADKESVFNKLSENGLMVCNLKIFGQENSLRIGVGDRETNKRIIRSLTIH